MACLSVLGLAGALWLAACSEGGGRASRGAAGGSAADDLTTQGEAAASRGARDQALAQFAKAIEINPRFVRAHMGMGDIYRVDGDYGKAERAYGKAAELEPANFDAQYSHGLMLHVLNRVTDAVSAYLRALRIRPDDFQANLNLATAYYQLGEANQALPFAETAVRLSPRSGPARLNLGSVYAAVGRDREALAEYQQASENMELTPALMTNLAEAYGKLGRFDEMRNTLLQLVKGKPTAQAYERLGFSSFKLGRINPELYVEARGDFEKALSLDANYFPALNGLGVCWLNVWIESERKDPVAKEKALDCLRKSIKINPDQPRILELLSRYGR